MFNEQDHALTVSVSRDAFEADRCYHGFPFCDILAMAYVGDNVAPTLSMFKEGVPCVYRSYSERTVAASGGLIAPDDMQVIFYDVGELDPKKHLISVRGAQWVIRNQRHSNHSDRTELQCRHSE